MSEARWEIQDGERVLGPYTDEDVFRAIAGTLPPTAPARLLGQDEWRPIGTVSPFAEVYMRRAVGAPTAAPAVSRALRVKKIDTLGGGCFVQGLGALLGGTSIFYAIAVARASGVPAEVGLPATVGVVRGALAGCGNHRRIRGVTMEVVFDPQSKIPESPSPVAKEERR